MDIALVTLNSFFWFSPHPLKLWCNQTNRITLPFAVCSQKWQRHRVCSLKEFSVHQIPMVRVGLELKTASWTKAQGVQWAALLNYPSETFVFMQMTGKVPLCLSLVHHSTYRTSEGSRRTDLLLSFMLLHITTVLCMNFWPILSLLLYLTPLLPIFSEQNISLFIQVVYHNQGKKDDFFFTTDISDWVKTLY